MFKWNKINKKWKWSLFPDTHLSNHTIPGSIDFLPMLAIGNQVKIDPGPLAPVPFPELTLAPPLFNNGKVGEEKGWGEEGRGCVSDSGTWGPPDSSLCLWHLWHLLRYKYNARGHLPHPQPAPGPEAWVLPPLGDWKRARSHPELPLLSPPQGQRACGSTQG